MTITLQNQNVVRLTQLGRRLLLLLLLALSLTPTISFAAKSWGDVANTTLFGVSLLGKAILMGAFCIGLAFLVGSVLKFKYHKDNPTQITFNSAVFLAVFGTALIALPLLTYVAGGTLFGRDHQRQSANNQYVVLSDGSVVMVKHPQPNKIKAPLTNNRRIHYS